MGGVARGGTDGGGEATRGKVFNHDVSDASFELANLTERRQISTCPSNALAPA